MVKLSRWLLHLLSQKIERRNLLCPIIVSIKIHIIASCVCSPKSVNTARDEQIFCDDPVKKVLRVIEKFPGVFANLRIFKNCGITPAQFPGVKKRRPIDIPDQRPQRKGAYGLILSGSRTLVNADPQKFRFRWNIVAPI